MYGVEVPDHFVLGATTLGYQSLGYRHGRSTWEISRESILCVGEATTESRVNGEDWLMCVITDTHGAWVEASLYSQGRNDALQWLSSTLGASMEVKLAHAPPFRSRIMWPNALRERPLFEYQVSTLRRAFSRGLRRLGFPAQGSVQTVLPAVLDFLRGARAPRPGPGWSRR